MANKTKKSKKQAKGQKKTLGRQAQLTLQKLDAGAIAFRNLLLDPCGAPFVQPTYSGCGTGAYRRDRIILASEGASVEGCYVFQPGTNSLWFGTKVAGTAGQAFAFSSAGPIVDAFGPTSEIRCLAACLKVRYTGAESARAGVIGLHTLPKAFLEPTVNATALSCLNLCPHISRFGEKDHEALFVPSDQDEMFYQPTTLGVPAFTDRHSTIVVVYRGIPASSLEMEFTMVTEGEAGLNALVSTIPPASGNTTNQLLRSMGNVASWAFKNAVVPTIKASYNAAMQSVQVGVQRAGNIAPLMIGL